MARIRLNLGRLTVPEKIAKTEQIIDSLTGNPNFPNPSPSLTTITTAKNELKTAAGELQAVNQSRKEKSTNQNAKEDVIDQLLTQLAAHVESVAGANEQMILSAGMDLRAVSTASTTPPDHPAALTATAGDRDGEIDLSWDPVSGARSYVVEQSADPATSATWTHAGVGTRSTFTVGGLASGTRYWFRVAAVNGNGQSGWSDPAIKMAP
jgi:hypothetical protein